MATKIKGKGAALIAGSRVEIDGSLVHFGKLAEFSWFSHDKQIYQKLPQLNGSNCYKLYKGYGHISPRTQVTPVRVPQFANIVRPKAMPRALATFFDDGTWSYGSVAMGD